MKNKKQIRTRPLAFSKLTPRLLIINVVALAIIGGGVLYLDQDRDLLTQDRLKAMKMDVQEIAADLLKTNAIPFDPSEPYGINMVAAQNFLREANQNIERFYEIIDEHRAKKAGYQVNLVAQALDAFYSNYDNTAIPLLEAVRIVSLAQDGETERADLYLLKAQKRYKP